MKKFHTLIVSSVSIFLMGVLVLVTLFLSNRTTIVNAGVGGGGGGGGGGTSSQVFDGCGWSDTIGWICFDKTQDYDVTEDSSGNLNGYGWSDNIGWLKFGGFSTSDMPSGRGNPASNARISGTNVSGWARFCGGMNNEAGYQTPPPDQTDPNNACSGVARSDGWDGWVSLTGKSDNNANYGWKIGDLNQKYAWGSDVVGWIDMSQVTLTSNEPPPIVDLTSTFTCDSSGSYNADLTWDPSKNTSDTTYTITRTIPAPDKDIPPGSGFAEDSGLIKNTEYSYTITATNLGGTANDTEDKFTPNVDCPVPPSIKFTAVPPAVDASTNFKCDLTWSDIQHVNIPAGDSCVITGPKGFNYVLATTTDGSVKSDRIDATYRYTLTCDNGNPPIAVAIATCSLKPVYHER